MNPRVKSVKVRENYELLIEFDSKVTKLFNVKPYLDYTVFKPLKEKIVFESVVAKYGTVVWGVDEEIDFDPDTLWLEGEEVTRQ